MTDELEEEAKDCARDMLWWLKLPINKKNVKDGGSRILKLLEPREERIEELEAQIERMSELINRYYMVCAEIPKEFRTMTFDSCLEDTVKMVQDRG